MTSQKSFRTTLVGVVIALVFGLTSGEVILRMMGVINFPIYIKDRDYGYVPAPNQKGRFLNRNVWQYNGQSMGNEEPFKPKGILLIGDSVVNGGLHNTQSDRLGPQLQKIVHSEVWPISAGGWSLDNELEYVKHHAFLLKVPTLIFVTNSGDLGEANLSPNNIQYPSRRPFSALFYLLERIVLQPHDQIESEVSTRSTDKWEADLAWLMSSYNGRLIWVIYPKKSELKVTPLPLENFARKISLRAEIIRVSKAKSWTELEYADSIHPTATGNRLLASIIANQLTKPNQYPRY